MSDWVVRGLIRHLYIRQRLQRLKAMNTFPNFFDEVATISLYDPLAEFLGAAEGGILQYGYSDAVRLAGHSCPTVAVAYALTHKALALLYPDSLPVRGDILVEFRLASDSGVTGVSATVASLLTGAASDSGFKGIAGRFDRRDRLRFNVSIPGEIRYTRLDTMQAVDALANLQQLPTAQRMPALMARCLSGGASAEQAAEFRSLWQERVRSILLDHWDNPAVFVLTEAKI